MVKRKGTSFYYMCGSILNVQESKVKNPIKNSDVNLSLRVRLAYSKGSKWNPKTRFALGKGTLNKAHLSLPRSRALSRRPSCSEIHNRISARRKNKGLLYFFLLFSNFKLDNRFLSYITIHIIADARWVDTYIYRI